MSIMSRTAQPPAAPAKPAAPAPNVGPASAPQNLMVLDLVKPLVVHGGTGPTRQLVFKREPTARLFIQYGQFFKIVPAKTPDEFPQFEIVHSIAMKWLEDLTGHDELVLDQLHPMDWLAACTRMRDLMAHVGN